jgi:ABC-type molybdenum transport system ATPase subunit/photorepair protein PhrA
LESAITHPLVRLERVDVDIAGTSVLRDIDWELIPNTFWGVVGANGSGKSTFLALVAGLKWPAPGRGARRYDFGNGIQTDAIEARRKITLVGPELQDRYVRASWNFMAEAVVMSGVFRTDIPRSSPSPADKIRAHALLREGGLTHLAERRFLELSRGEQRRVLIARSLAFRPRVLLLDEPASGLDRDARRELDAMLERIAATTTIVCSAHEARDLPSSVSDVLYLEGGRITARLRPKLAPTEGCRSNVAGGSNVSRGSGVSCGSGVSPRFLTSRPEAAPTGNRKPGTWGRV